MFQTDKTDYKSLCRRVSELEDMLSSLKRMIYDVQTDMDGSRRITGKLLKEKDGIKASLTVAADKIESVAEKTDGNTKDISRITQTADRIESTVAKYKTENSESIAQLESKITQTADEIKTEVNNYTDGKVSEVSQTAEGIKATVKNRFGDVVLLDSADSPKTDKTKVYFYNGSYWYYSAVDGAWLKTDDEFVQSTFLQTADGFELDGSVRINGNAYVNGEISGSAFYDSEKRGLLTLAATSGYSDMTYKNTESGKEYFKIYDGRDNAVSMFLNGYSIGYSAGSNTFYPTGTWDFSSSGCTVTGLNNVIGTAVAVFG